MQGLSQRWLHYFQGCPAPRSLPTLSALPVSRFQLSFELIGLEQIISLSEGLPNCTPLYAYCSGGGCFHKFQHYQGQHIHRDPVHSFKGPQCPRESAKVLRTRHNTWKPLISIPYTIPSQRSRNLVRPQNSAWDARGSGESLDKMLSINCDSAYPICLGASKSSRTASVTISSGCDATHP
jgi:hypothetical protein